MNRVEIVAKIVFFSAICVFFVCASALGVHAQALPQSPAYTPWAIGFYSFAVTILVVFFGLNVSVRNTAGLYVSALFAGMLLSIWMLEDGLIGLFPDMGRPLNDSFVLSVGQLTCAIGFAGAVQIYHPDQLTLRTKTILWGLVLLALLTIPILWVIQDFNLWMGVANTLIVLMIASQVAATRTWRTHDARRRIVPATTAILALLACIIILILYLVSDGRAWIEQGAILRIFFVIVAFPTMLGVLLELVDMRKARDTALQEAVSAARRDAETSANLLKMEKQYARARETADARTRQLSAASHDIRQPIASMRAELDAMRSDSSDPSVERIVRALDHLNELTADLSNAGAQSPEAGLHGAVEHETLAVGVLLETLDKLLSADARQNGVALNFVPSSAMVSAPPLILIRIMSNLLMNAITHSGATKVLIGVRHRADHVRLDVLDNGNGFAGGSVEWAFEHGQRGEQSTGTGQGLAIVKDLADKYDIPLSYWTGVGLGSRISLTLPIASNSA